MNKWIFKYQVRRVFGIRPIKEKSLIETEGTMGHLGYPQLFQREIFLSAYQRLNWIQDHRIELPACCCVCGTPGRVALPCYHSNGWWRSRTLILADVPHCKIHATDHGNAQLIVEPISFEQQIVSLWMVGKSDEFLKQVDCLSQQEDPPPPWVIFPEYPRYSSAWRQGYGEFWWNTVWAPFWDSLSNAQKKTYLAKFLPPKHWQDLC